MTPKERSPLHETTPQEVYSKAREILDLHGHPETRPMIAIFSRPDGRPRSIPITGCPIVPIQIAGNEYRLWLRSEDDNQPDNRNGAIELSIHFQQLPLDLNRIEYDGKGYVTGYWYKPKDLQELKHVQVISRSNVLPKELEFFWYIAKLYSIKPNDNGIRMPEWFPPERFPDIRDGNESLLTILENMQTELKTKSN